MEITTGRVCGRTWYIAMPDAVIGCYRLEKNNIILLDSGSLGHGELEEWIERQGFRVCAILNSHEHWDHVMGNGYFQREHGTAIYMPKLEAAMYATDVARRINHQPGALSKVQQFYRRITPYRVDVELGPEDGETEVCGARFRVIHTPGHSIDHVVYITPDNVMYGGDVLMSPALVRQAKLSYAACHEIDLQSKEKLRQYDCAAYILAHGSVEREIAPVIDANIAFVQGRAEDLYRMIAHPMSMEEIIRLSWQRFGLRSGGYYKNMEISNMIRALVQYLVSNDRLECRYCDGVDYYARLDNREESEWN